MSEATNTSGYILVAEDNSADVYLVREALIDRDLKCTINVVTDGDQAIRFVDTLDRDLALQCPILLLLDLHLPKRSGEEILSHWRASARCAKIPVIVFTSSDDPSHIQSLKRNGPNYYFRKPASLDQFLKLGDLVRDIISDKRNPTLGVDSTPANPPG